MEEDIKILEEFIKDVMPEYTETYIDDKKVRIDLIEIETKPSKKIAQAIENLINRVKELEEAVDNFMRGKAYSTKQLENLKKNFIQKSKIREKLEERQNSFKKTCELNDCDTKYETLNKLQYEIEVLQELLGG